jgi:hypothetical protein
MLQAVGAGVKGQADFSKAMGVGWPLGTLKVPRGGLLYGAASVPYGKI